MPDDSRRRFLLAVAAGGLAARCARAPAASAAARVAVADLAGAAPVTVLVHGRPVHVRRAGSEIVAISLACTHMGCTVRWDDAQAQYVCPCHDGRFAADGRHLAGPPPRPLDRVAVRVEGAEVLVG